MYRARRAGLQGAEHLVALKVILPDRLGSYRDVDRFVKEVRAMVRFNHRGVLSVSDSGEHLGQPYVAMKLVGPSLEAVLAAREKIAPSSAAKLVAEIARAVDYLHQHDVVHCDLKPSNILLDGDQPVITDFGLIRILNPGPELGPQGPLRMEGTIPYMAPEQVRGYPAKSTDIYALGVVLMELLTGRTPFGKGCGSETNHPPGGTGAAPFRPRHSHRARSDRAQVPSKGPLRSLSDGRAGRC